jgi:hypothetical protein
VCCFFSKSLCGAKNKESDSLIRKRPRSLGSLRTRRTQRRHMRALPWRSSRAVLGTGVGSSLSLNRALFIYRRNFKFRRSTSTAEIRGFWMARKRQYFWLRCPAVSPMVGSWLQTQLQCWMHKKSSLYISAVIFFVGMGTTVKPQTMNAASPREGGTSEACEHRPQYRDCIASRRQPKAGSDRAPPSR